MELDGVVEHTIAEVIADERRTYFVLYPSDGCYHCCSCPTLAMHHCSNPIPIDLVLIMEVRR